MELAPILSFVSSLLVLFYTIWRERSKARLEVAQAKDIEVKSAAEASDAESKLQIARADVVDRVNQNALVTIDKFDQRLKAMEESYERRLEASEEHYKQLWTRLLETERELLLQKQLHKESETHYEEQICKLRALINDMQIKIRYMEAERNELLKQKEEAVSQANYWKGLVDAKSPRS